MYTTFTPILNYDILPAYVNTNLIFSSNFGSSFDCVKKCASLKTCLLIIFKSNLCNLYSQLNFNYLISSPSSSVILEKFNKDFSSVNAFLTNHWPFNNNFNDIISGANIFNGINYAFTKDRLNSDLSAVYLNNGYLQVPAGIYFNGDLTISLWIKIFQYTSNCRILEFALSSGISTETVFMGISGKVFYLL